MTTRSTAIYRAKQAFALMTTRGIAGALVRLETATGTRWQYTDSESGYIVILKAASDYRAIDGAVDATATKAANATKAAEPAPVPPGFDVPRTKALRAFIAAEGPNGSGRVVGISIEPDGVFIYTDSAQWQDDAGAGTFRADSETGAIAAFRERVRPAPVAEPDNRAAKVAAIRARRDARGMSDPLNRLRAHTAGKPAIVGIPAEPVTISAGVAGDNWDRMTPSERQAAIVQDQTRESN